MKAVVEPLEGNKVKLSIEVDEQEFEKDIDAAFRKIAREVRIPGFRPGKAPRRILEARLGKETGRAEALRDALPVYYTKAVREQEVDAIAAPEIEIKDGETEGPVTFDAVVEVRPQIRLIGYDNLRVVVPRPEATDDEIEAQIDRMRGNFGELGAADRPARDGDFMTIDMEGTRDGEPVSGLSYEDFMYELGSGSVLAELDIRLPGTLVGDVLEFEAEVPGSEAAQLKVTVKEIKEKVLPELTDEFASEASEFETAAELREDIAKRVGLVKKYQSTMALRANAMEALVALVTEEPPEALVQAELERQVHDLSHRLEQQGASLNDYLQATGQGPEELLNALRVQAIPSVKADLALRAVAELQEIDPTEADIDEEIVKLAQAYNMKPNQVRRNLERADQMPAVRSDWKKGKALEWVLEHVDLVDSDGRPVDRALFEPDSELSEAAAASDEASSTSEEAAESADSAVEDEETGES